MLHKLSSVEVEAETVNAVRWGVWDKCRGYMVEGSTVAEDGAETRVKIYRFRVQGFRFGN